MSRSIFGIDVRITYRTLWSELAVQRLALALCRAVLAVSHQFHLRQLAADVGALLLTEQALGAGVDRSTVMNLRQVAKQGALEALAASRPGVKAGVVDPELAEARAEIARLSEALKEMGVRLMLAEGKGRWD